MKKILLFIAIILAINPNNQAQNCFPDSSYITPGYYPDSLYPAHLNANYEQTVTIIVPKDTLIELIPGFPITIDIDSIVVTSITNLPVGFSYICEPVSCGFLGNERGCLKIIGNPVDPSLVGEFNLIGQVKAYAAQAGALSPLDETVNLGKFSILSPVSISKNSEAAIASLQVYPNPIQQNSTLLFTAAQKSIYNLNIYNVLGSKVVTQSINVNKGENKFPLNFSKLQNGIYLISLSGDGFQQTTRVLVTNN